MHPGRIGPGGKQHLIRGLDVYKRQAYSRLTCVAAGHYYTEKVFAEFLASYLRKRVPDTAFLLSQVETAPMRVL